MRTPDDEVDLFSVSSRLLAGRRTIDDQSRVFLARFVTFGEFNQLSKRFPWAFGRQDVPMRKFRFTTRRLLLLTFVIASVLAALIGLHRAGQQAFGVGPIRDAEKWPAALKELLGDSPLLQNDVSVYALGNFIDHESVWVIKSGSPLIDRLRANNSLELVSGSHPKAKRLLASLPYGWPTIDTANCTWHATHGFGSQHIEGVNLFLVAKDETTGICFVLHEWIF